MATIFILEINLETESCVVVLNMSLIMYNIAHTIFFPNQYSFSYKIIPLDLFLLGIYKVKIGRIFNGWFHSLKENVCTWLYLSHVFYNYE